MNTLLMKLAVTAAVISPRGMGVFGLALHSLANEAAALRGKLRAVALDAFRRASLGHQG